jgi:uncharacterized protein with HEPN domain
MDLEIKKWLKDIELAISEINSFFPEKKIFSEFQSDVKGRKAVERNIEIIGEALSRILKLKPEIIISDARKIVDTRNRSKKAKRSFNQPKLTCLINCENLYRWN